MMVKTLVKILEKKEDVRVTPVLITMIMVIMKSMDQKHEAGSRARRCFEDAFGILWPCLIYVD
jgi:hypothetical protein